MKTTRWLCCSGVLLLVAALSSQTAYAQGDGPRTHWKGMLAGTSIVNFSLIHISGNSRPLDPTNTLSPDANFSGNLVLVGYSIALPIAGRTVVASVLAPVGELEVGATGPMSLSESARGWGNPILQVDANLFGTPAMLNMPALLRYEPTFTVDFFVNVAFPIGDYDEDSLANIGQNRWYGRAGVPIMVNLGDWIPGKRTTFELLPSVYLFLDNDDFLGQKVKNDPLLQVESHLTRDINPNFWVALSAAWLYGGNATIGGMQSDELNVLTVGFTLGHQINGNLALTTGYNFTVAGDLDMGTLGVNLIYGWHPLIEGINRLIN